jgi:hypothetical protein
MAKFLVKIGDNTVELKGKTREDALKRVGLNPQYWKGNKGEKMAKENQPKITSATEKIPQKKTAPPLKDKPVVIRQLRKSNITTENIGRLDIFIPEPQVSMSKVASHGGDPEKHEVKKGNLADFENFQLLIPAPEPRKHVKKKG